MHSFPCGTRVLDFVGTLQARRDASRVEMLATTTQLDAWLTESALVTEPIATNDAALAAAVDLREAIYALMWSRLHGTELPGDAVDTVNLYAAQPPVRPLLLGGNTERVGDATQALSQLAREAIEIAGGEEAALLRECGRPGCTQVYLDHSRGLRREWCSMATCGSRVKAQAYRDRKKAREGAVTAGAAS